MSSSSLPPLSTWARNIAPSPTLAVDAKAKALAAAGEDVCSFAAGEPDFDTPQHIKDACIAALQSGKTKYIATNGLEDLRKAIAEEYGRVQGLKVSPAQIVVSPGGKFSCYLAVIATCSPGDEVIIPRPVLGQLSGDGEAGRAPFRSRPRGGRYRGLQADAGAARGGDHRRTRLLILNSPSNPTGAVYSRAELEAIMAVAVRTQSLRPLRRDLRAPGL